MRTETEKTGGGDRGLWLQLFPEDLTRLVSDRDTFTKYLYPLARWHLGMEYEPPQGIEADFIFGKLKDQQLRSAESQQKRRDGGKQTAEKRWGDSKQVASDKQASSKQVATPPPSYPNENENENENSDLNENETKTATVSPPPLDRVSVSSSEIDKAITAAAALLGDQHPSRVVWADFIQRHGLDAFNAQVNNAATSRSVEKRGAYLNTLLKVYTPPPPPPKPQKPRTFTKEDWTLCCERCANFDGKVCTKGIKTPPDKDLGHPHTPEECQSYKAKPKSETPPDRPAPSIDFGTTLKRVNDRR